jgi:hypothetical protein
MATKLESMTDTLLSRLRAGVPAPLLVSCVVLQDKEHLAGGATTRRVLPVWSPVDGKTGRQA